MDSVKEAFLRVKQDIDSLKQEMDILKNNLKETRENVIELCEIFKKISQKKQYFDQNQGTDTPTQTLENPTLPTHIPTHNLPFKPLKPQNIGFSIGNEGVPTDRQTNQQTNQHIENSLKNTSEIPKTTIENASELLDSLDSIKKELRLKFKNVTEQELLIFSTVYQLDQEQGYTDYKTLSKKLNLSESSIRDYIGKLIKKGIPVEKIKINNKNIQLKISENLKKIASLSTILQLREL